MESIWSRNCEIPKRHSLNHDITTDVAVIGAGMAGILIAYHLQEQGIKTVVLDAERIAGGVTKNTTAKITAQHSLIYGNLIKGFGEESARQYAQANMRAIQRYQEIIEKEKIECSFEMKPSYVYSTGDVVPLQDEAKAAKQLGIDAEFTQKTTLPFHVRGAVKFNNQAQFHPLEFIKAISSNLTVYEHTRVKEVQENGVVTESGFVKANTIIFACHFPFLNMPGFYFARMHQERSYVLALENAGELDGMYIDMAEGGLSFRTYNQYLLLGGEGHRTGKMPPYSCYQKLRETASKLYPNANEVANWSAQDCTPLDSVPYIGPFSSSTPNWFVATGFNKWGMTSSMAAAQILTDMVLKKDVYYALVFSPQRFQINAELKNFVTDSAQAVNGLLLKKMQPAKRDWEEIPAGHGGIVNYDGEKVGVYKNEKEECFIVSIKCPHLGCQLEWNQDELSWDCPCHGSRFDYRGNLIGGPAQENLLLPSED